MPYTAPGPGGGSTEPAGPDPDPVLPTDGSNDSNEDGYFFFDASDVDTIEEARSFHNSGMLSYEALQTVIRRETAEGNSGVESGGSDPGPDPGTDPGADTGMPGQYEQPFNPQPENIETVAEARNLRNLGLLSDSEFQQVRQREQGSSNGGGANSGGSNSPSGSTGGGGMVSGIDPMIIVGILAVAAAGVMAVRD